MHLYALGFEKEQGGVVGRFWRKDREGRNDVIIIAITIVLQTLKK